MKRQSIRAGLVVVTVTMLFVGAFGVSLYFARRPQLAEAEYHRSAQAAQSARGSTDDTASPATPQVVVGTPEFYDQPVNNRYTYRNEFPNDQTQWRSLYLIDTEAGQETRLGDDNRAAIFGAMNDKYLLWFYLGEGIHLYTLATETDRFIHKATATLEPQIAGDWIAFGDRNQVGSDLSHTLYAANLQTNEIITLTRSLNTPGGGGVSLAFGISQQLAAWLVPPDTIVIYDLNRRRELTRLTDIFRAFDEQDNRPILAITPGESVVTWSSKYGYDLVTQSYFRIENRQPADWGNALIWDMSRIHEENRVLSWSFDMKDGTQRHVRAPLIDATPSTTPCVERQNLVQDIRFTTTCQ